MFDLFHSIHFCCTKRRVFDFYFSIGSLCLFEKRDHNKR